MFIAELVSDTADLVMDLVLEPWISRVIKKKKHKKQKRKMKKQENKEKNLIRRQWGCLVFGVERMQQRQQFKISA